MRGGRYLPILRDRENPQRIEAIFQSTELLQSLPLSEEEIRQKVGVDEKSTLRLGIWGAPEIPYKLTECGCQNWEVMAVAREARSEDLSQDNLTRQELKIFCMDFVITSVDEVELVS